MRLNVVAVACARASRESLYQSSGIADIDLQATGMPIFSLSAQWASLFHTGEATKSWKTVKVDERLGANGYHEPAPAASRSLDQPFG